MEATATASTTGVQTIAGLVPRSAAAHAEHVAVRYKRDGAWHDVTYAQLLEVVDELGLGLIDLGIQPGECVSILANTRPEWSYFDLAATSAGAIVVPIYPTNSAEECLWGALGLGRLRGHLRETRSRRAKIAAIKDHSPEPAHRDGDRPAPGRRQRLGGARRTRSRRSRSSSCASAGANTPSGSSKRVARASNPRTPSRSSTRPARPARRRAACSHTAMTARSSTCSQRSGRSKMLR